MSDRENSPEYGEVACTLTNPDNAYADLRDTAKKQKEEVVLLTSEPLYRDWTHWWPPNSASPIRLLDAW